MTSHTHVVVAGGGVAAIETCMALRELAGDRVVVTLIAPSAYFVYRPVSVHDPLAVRGRVRVPLARFADDAGVDLRRDRVADVDVGARRVRTASGHELAYDALVLAVGAVPLNVPTGAVPFAPSHTAGCQAVIRRLCRGDVGSVAFVEPPAPAQSLELYDVALETAVAARCAGVSPALTLVTAQPAPLATGGARASDAAGRALASHGVRVVESAYVRSITAGELDLAPGAQRVLAEQVIAAPRLGGPRPQHLPCDADGFLLVDPSGRVSGVAGVFAAGDCTAFPVKHPSLAAQQGDAVASAIAADAGADVAPEPYEPVLRCMLPSRLRWYVEAPLTGGQGDATLISTHPLWAGGARFGARHLTPLLAELEHGERADRGDNCRGDGRHRVAAAMAAH